MRDKILTAPSFLAILIILVPQATQAASTVVATINGFYDVDGYDTPSLHIDNSSSYDFTNVQLKLTGYQGLNAGMRQSVGLANITAGTTVILPWGSIAGANGSTSGGNLFAYDYDDSYSGTFTPQTGYGLSGSHTLVAAPQCNSQAPIYGWNYCAQPGPLIEGCWERSRHICRVGRSGHERLV